MQEKGTETLSYIRVPKSVSVETKKSGQTTRSKRNNGGVFTTLQIGRDALVHNSQQCLVFERCLYSFLVSKLLVDGMLAGMSARLDADSHTESSWQTPQEFDPKTKPNKGGHGTMGNSRTVGGGCVGEGGSCVCVCMKSSGGFKVATVIA